MIYHLLRTLWSWYLVRGPPRCRCRTRTAGPWTAAAAPGSCSAGNPSAWRSRPAAWSSPRRTSPAALWERQPEDEQTAAPHQYLQVLKPGGCKDSSKSCGEKWEKSWKLAVIVILKSFQSCSSDGRSHGSCFIPPIRFVLVTHFTPGRGRVFYTNIFFIQK